MSGSGILIDATVNSILVVLLDAKIAFGDGEGRVVKDNHDHDRIAALFPRMVAKGFAQGVADDLPLDAGSLRRGDDHAVGL